MTLKEFTQSVWPFKDKLYRFAYRLVGNGPEAEDVVQEVLMKLWTKKHELHQYQNLEAWCMKMTRNKSIDQLRTRKHRLGGMPQGMDCPDDGVTPYQHTAQKDTFRHINNMMQQLPEKQRLTMQLRDMEGMTYKEISEILDISMNQVKVNLFRARKHIRQLLINQQTYGR
ncbi:MAG: sigma-70 family RNA polymerase sigma factor [Bacteroidota bacterium]